MGMQALLWAKDSLQVNFKIHKKLILWLSLFFVIGIIIAIVTVSTQTIDIDQINIYFIDNNIINSASIKKNFFSFIWHRVNSVLLPLTIIFLFASLSIRLGHAASIAFITMHGYWITVSIWWIFVYFEISAWLLGIFYIIWLLILSIIFIFSIVWLLKITQPICRMGIKNGCDFNELLKGGLIIVFYSLILGLLEYFTYWIILGRIVYKSV